MHFKSYITMTHSVGDIIDVPLQTNLYIGILPYVVIINL